MAAVFIADLPVAFEEAFGGIRKRQCGQKYKTVSAVEDVRSERKMIFKGFLLVQVFLLFLISQARGFQLREEKSTALPPSSQNLPQKRLDVGQTLNRDQALSPERFGDGLDDSGLVEVKESEIPEGAMVYVLEEPEDSPADGETLKTAANIVFRPLFRYRSKQEAQRRNSNRVRRRYFVPRRSYREAYYYPYHYYYPRRYY